MNKKLATISAAVFVLALLLAMSGMTVAAQGPTATPTTEASPTPAAPAPAGSPTPAAAPPAAPPSAATADDPAAAATLGSAVQALSPGGAQWFRFDYDTPANTFPHRPVTIRLLNGVSSGLEFEVWSPEKFQQGNWWEISPVGRGTREVLPHCAANPETTQAPFLAVDEDGKCRTNDLTWTGAFGVPATYWVRLENKGTTAIAPQLVIGGSGLKECANVDFTQTVPLGQVPAADQGFARVQCLDVGPGQVIATP